MNQLDLYQARAMMERSYREFTYYRNVPKRQMTNIVVYAERDIFKAIVDSLECQETITHNVSLTPTTPGVPNFYYKDALVFRVERDGWGLKFMAHIEETYR
jgi:hypothetical protein